MSTSSEKLTEKTLLELLKELNQDHIISLYEKEENPDAKKAFLDQINSIQELYHGGIKEYVRRAKILLENSRKGINPYDGYIPSVPTGENLTVGSDNFYEFEKIGFDEIKDTCFTLVAGGLGERLGYPDIKIGIETDLITKRRFFDIYTEYLLAYESRFRKKFNLGDDWFIPLAIMTSGDTHDKTMKLLKDNNNFGLKPEQIDIVKQGKFPSLLDNDCHFSLEKGKLLLETKPHGHGDIHTLLYSKGVIQKWIKLGKKWMIIIQDTNSLSLNVAPSALGVCKKLDLCANSICIPRRPGDSIGGICKLTKGSEEITINVEYNQLDDLLKATYNPKGDVANSSGYSDFPGNLNILFFKLDPYFKALEKTHGLIDEFINPKYANSEKTKFKSPTRLECMMQDFPKLFKNNEKVGFTSYEKWFCFSTLKNNLESAFQKLSTGNFAEAGFSIEQDLFNFNVIILKDILKNLTVDESEKKMEVDILGHNVCFGPKIIVYPSFACCLSEMKEKIKHKIHMTQNSTLIIKNDIKIEKDICVDGILVIDKDVTEEIKCDNKLRNIYVSLKQNEGENYEKIRGYTMKICP